MDVRVHMDMTVMDLPMAANNMAIHNLGIVTLPHITPLHMDRHNMVIHITQATNQDTATPGKGIRTRIKLGKRGPKHQIGTGAAKAAD